MICDASRRRISIYIETVRSTVTNGGRADREEATSEGKKRRGGVRAGTELRGPCKWICKRRRRSQVISPCRCCKNGTSRRHFQERAIGDVSHCQRCCGRIRNGRVR